MISAANIRDIFTCDFERGLLYWKMSTTNRIKIGDRAGNKSSNGYWNVRYLNRYYGAHRLIWLYVHGKWPEQDIDHINGIRDDNRLSNLRSVTRSQNIWNSRSKKQNGGKKGAYYNKKTNIWHSQITRDGIITYLGSFHTEDEAHAAYCKAATALHGEFARLA